MPLRMQNMCSEPGLQRTWLKVSEVIWFYRRPPLLLQNYWPLVNWDAKSYIQRLYNLLVKQLCFSKYGRTSKRPHRSWLSTSQVSSMPLDNTTHPESSLFWQWLHFIHKKHGFLSALMSSCEIFCASHCSARCVPVIASERRVFPFLLHCTKDFRGWGLIQRSLKPLWLGSTPGSPLTFLITLIYPYPIT